MAKSTYSYAIKSIPTENDPDAILKQTITDIKANATAAGYRQVTGQLREMVLGDRFNRYAIDRIECPLA